MGHAADGDHPRTGRRLEQVEEPPGEGEVAEVVGAELELKAIGGLPAMTNSRPPGLSAW